MQKLVFIGVVESYTDYLPLSYSLISAAGALVVLSMFYRALHTCFNTLLASTPRGFTIITSYGLRLYLPAATRKNLADKIFALEMAQQTIEDKMKGTH